MRSQSLESSYDLLNDSDNESVSSLKDSNLTTTGDYPLWESRLYFKPQVAKKSDNKRLSRYDNCNFFKFLTFIWLRDWIKYVSSEYIQPYKLHPLPVSDQILRWQPIFSKHVSDGLVRLESYQTLKSKGEKIGKKQYPYKSILLRALFLTFWKRTLFGLVGIILINIMSMSLSMLVNYYMKRLKVGNYEYFVFFVFTITFFQFIDGFCFDHFTFYMYRLVCIIHYSVSLTTFQHGLCHRRRYFNNIEGSNSLGACNRILHSCSPDSECSKNPLFCPALRHQNKDITPIIFSLEFIDSYFISVFLECLIALIQFLCNSIYGFILIKFYIKLKVSLLISVTVGFVFVILILEGINTFVLDFIYTFKDYRISKCRDIICSIYIIVKMALDSIAHNIITETRNTELSLIFIRLLLSFTNKIFLTILVSMIFLFILDDFVDQLKKVNDIQKIDSIGLLTMLYILLKFIYSISLFPQAIKQMYTSIASFRRVKTYISDCSPNFYISDNKFTGSVQMSSSINNETTEIPKDVVVLYKDATFSWVGSRKDILTKNYQPYLKNVNFQLKRGEIVIITGCQGSGKSNFIKSVLGEMTLVGGSMAVVPLYTSMPIFYASQDIWLQQGTIRYNVTFGYKFDETIYNNVLRAVELEYDISTWEKGDMRVVSDNGYCLSGGQRVRMELARALYAYLIFNQVNKNYSNGKCSFVMCLDSPFHGLDPFVSKTVFNNLFNAKSGIIVKDDLAVILSSSKRSLDICLSQSDLKQFPNMPIYNISNMNVYLSVTLHSFTELPGSPVNMHLPPESANTTQPVVELETEPTKTKVIDFSDFIDKTYGLARDLARRSSTVSVYRKSVYVENKESYNSFKPYANYFLAAGFSFIFFLVLTFVSTIMDNLKFVFSSGISDYIDARTSFGGTPEEMMNRFADIKTYSDRTLNKISIFTVCVVLVCLLATVFLVLSCIIASRRIHEYCINSIFVHSSAVIKIKKHICQLITYLSSDIFQIDESLGYSMSTALVSLVESFIHIATMCYLIPLSIPIIVIVIFIIIKFVFKSYVNASKNLQIASLESSSQINGLCDNAISGSVTCRCFKKEGELMNSIVEHTDYYMRCLFLNKSVLARSSIISKGLFSLVNLVLVIPVLRQKYFNYKLEIGLYGLALSLGMILSNTFTNFMISFGKLEIFMCSMKRFENFVPPGTKVRFAKKKNTKEEHIIVKYSDAVSTESQANITKNTLYKRRDNEYAKAYTCYRPLKMLHEPKIVKLDVSKHIPSGHFGVQIKDLYVSASEKPTKTEKYILININASASASDIIGVIGRTGSGKTTLLSVIQNTVRTRTGNVLLDGTDLNDIPNDILSQIIGVLPQLPFVFKGWTVRRFLDPRKLFSDDEINLALENCGLLEFVNKLPGLQKLDTVIIQDEFKFNSKRKKVQPQKHNPRLSKYRNSLNVKQLKNYYVDSDMILSSSQLRTLSFARLVLYRDFFRIILIDEPPSENCLEEEEGQPADQEIGTPIYELIKRYFSHCTTFLTAHDANALVLCSSVWVLHHGNLIRTCSREEIAANESISNIIEESLRRKGLDD